MSELRERGPGASASESLACDILTAVALMPIEPWADGAVECEVDYVDFFEVVGSRRSVRSFKKDPVTDEDLKKILGAVNAAPSAGNLQAYEVVVVRDGSTKKKLAKAAWGQNFIADAPVCLVFLANPRRSGHEYGARGRELYCIQDATIAAEHAHLSCVPLGLSSVWVGAYSEEAVAQAISAPPHMRPVCMLPIGSPGEDPAPVSRRALADLVHKEKVGESWSVG